MTITKAVLANSLSRLINVGVSLFATSIAYRYLGYDKFGIWSVLTSIILVFSAFGDAGITQGLIGSVAKLREQKGERGVGEAVTAALLLTVFTVTLSTFIIISVGFLIGFEGLFGEIKTTSRSTLLATFTVVVVGFIGNVFANFFTNIRHGLNQVFEISNWNSIGSLLVIPMTGVAVHLNAGMAGLTAAIFLPPIICRLLANAYHVVSRPHYRPHPAKYNRPTFNLVTANGAAFFVIAASMAIAQHTDQLVISFFHGPEAVTPYAILNRVFSVPVFLMTAISNAVWPYLSIYFVQNKFDQLRNIFSNYFIVISALGVVIALILFVLLDNLLLIWLRSDLDLKTPLAMAFLYYAIIVTPVGFLTLLIISMEMRRAQLLGSLSMCVINLLMTFILVPKFGSVGAILSTGLSYTLCLLIPYSYLVITKFYRSGSS